MHYSYNFALVALSFVVAVAASYTALELSRRVSTASNAGSRRWLTAGSFSMGFGIWTMHFIGMLALSMPVEHYYDVSLTATSLLIAILASAFAIFVASRPGISAARISISGLLLGAGIAAMHYIGMAAMVMDADVVYDTPIVLLSIAIAIVAATVAIWIIFTLIHTTVKYSVTLSIIAATIMGIGICGMHYTAMAAANYTPWPDARASLSDGSDAWMAIVIGAAALIILAITQLTILFDHRLTIERAQREKSVRKATQLSEILDESTNEIFLFDAFTFRFVYVNRGALENLGYSADELSEMTPMDLSEDVDRDSMEELVRPMREGKKLDMLFNHIHRRKDGSEYPAQVHLQMHATAQPPLFAAIVNDVTSKIELENQLAQAMKMESIGQLAAGIAHEINTPTQYVGDNTRFVQDGFTDLLPLFDRYAELADAVRRGTVTDDCLRQVDVAAEAADAVYLREQIPLAIEQSLEGIARISSIVRAMKKFSHPGSKSREATDLNRAIENTVLVASNEWRYVADVEMKLDPDLPLVPCYPQEINQVLLNLIVNAAHAIEEKNRDTEAEKGTITIATRCDRQMAIITVTDAGCGIRKEHLNRLFEPFFTTKDVGKGTGQGLPMAYRSVVDAHGGTLTATSQLGRGATFTVRLPLTEPADESRTVRGQAA